MNKNLYIYSALLFLIISCSTKKDGFTNKIYNSKVGWFNTLFNGNEAFKKQYNGTLETHQDKFYEIIPVVPFTLKKGVSFEESFNEFMAMPGQNEAQIAEQSGYERAIDKARSAIKHHSMMINGKDKNKIMGEAYLLLGKSRYYSTEYLEALEALNFIQKNISKPRKKVLQESKVYLALANHSLQNDFEANEIFTELLNSKLKKVNRKLVAKSYAQFLLDKNKYEEALEALDVVYKKDKSSRSRVRFIQGQIYQQLEKNDLAREHYYSAYKKAKTTDILIKSNIAMAEIFDSTKVDFKDEYKRLKSLSKVGLYEPKKNELLYALGLLHDNANKKTDAEKYYKLALKEKESDPNIRGLNYLAIAKLYFKESNYVHSGAYYDSAFTKIEDPKAKSKIDLINRSMKKIIANHYLVKKNDSILSVVAKSPEEKVSYFGDYITKLKEKEEKIKKEKDAKESNNQDFSFDSFGINSKNNSQDNTKFYFYNQAAKNKGVIEFKRIWGERQMQDNWRNLSNSNSNSTTVSADKIEDKLLGQDDKGNYRRFEVDYYLGKLPKNQVQIDSIKKVRDLAELELGIDYFDKFKDKKLSTETLVHLIESPVKDNDVKVRAYYNLYKINKDDNLAISENYKNKVVSEFPETKFAKNILNPPSNRKLVKSTEGTKAYEKAFELYKASKYEECKAEINAQINQFSNDKIGPKFLLLSSYCDGKLQNKPMLIETLQKIVANYNDTDEAKKAQELLQKLIEQPKEIDKNIPKDSNKPDEFEEEVFENNGPNFNPNQQNIPPSGLPPN